VRQILNRHLTNHRVMLVHLALLQHLRLQRHSLQLNLN